MTTKPAESRNPAAPPPVRLRESFYVSSPWGEGKIGVTAWSVDNASKCLELTDRLTLYFSYGPGSLQFNPTRAEARRLSDLLLMAASYGDDHAEVGK